MNQTKTRNWKNGRLTRVHERETATLQGKWNPKRLFRRRVYDPIYSCLKDSIAQRGALKQMPYHLKQHIVNRRVALKSSVSIDHRVTVCFNFDIISVFFLNIYHNRQLEFADRNLHTSQLIIWKCKIKFLVFHVFDRKTGKGSRHKMADCTTARLHYVHGACMHKSLFYRQTMAKRYILLDEMLISQHYSTMR